MGAGLYPAGVGLCGFGPITEAARVIPVMPEAAAYDPSVRDFPLAATGDLESVHPVDQGVAIACGIPLEGVAPTPGVGIDVARLRRASRASMQSTVTDVVKGALARFIANGDIDFLGAPLMPEANGRPFFFVDYRNLRLPGLPTTRLPIRSGG